MKEYFDIVFKILLLVALVWIAFEIRAIHIPHEIDATVRNVSGLNFGVEIYR